MPPSMAADRVARPRSSPAFVMPERPPQPLLSPAPEPSPPQPVPPQMRTMKMTRQMAPAEVLPAPQPAVPSLPPPPMSVRSAMASREVPVPSTPRAFASPPRMPGSAGDDASSPLSYQVYAGDVPLAMRAPSRASFAEISAKKPTMSLGARVCLVLAGVCVVVATAGLIMLGTADEPRAHTRSSASTSSTDGTNAATGAAAAAPSPAPEPPPVVAAPPPEAAPAPLPVATTPTKKSKAAGSASPSLRGVAIPPNPFGGSGGAAPKPSAKKK